MATVRLETTKRVFRLVEADTGRTATMDSDHELLTLAATFGFDRDAHAPLDVGEAACACLEANVGKTFEDDGTWFAPVGEADLWDNCGAFWYVGLPADTVDGLFSEGHLALTITRECDGYWLSNSGEVGSDRFDTLVAAKRAGNAVLDEAYAAQAAKILDDAGLDPALWSVSLREPVTFTHTPDPSLAVIANSDEPGAAKRWTAWSGDDEVGAYDTPKESVAALLDRPAPGL